MADEVADDLGELHVTGPDGRVYRMTHHLVVGGWRWGSAHPGRHSDCRCNPEPALDTPTQAGGPITQTDEAAGTDLLDTSTLDTEG